MTAGRALSAAMFLGSHVALIVAIAAMAGPQLWRIPAELAARSGPTDYGYIAVLSVPAVLAPLLLGALLLWTRPRARPLLIAVDLTTTLAASTIFWVFIFASDFVLPVIVLAPLCAVLALVRYYRAAMAPLARDVQ